MIIDPFAYMDHSGGDELLGEPERVHSTAILMSVGAAALSLTEMIKPEITTQGGLGKWSTRSDAYKQQFAAALSKILPKSGAFLFGLSARESAITANRDLLVNELGLTNRYTVSNDEKGRPVWSFPPVKNHTGETIHLDFRERQVLMLLLIAHFLARSHREFFNEVRKTQPNVIVGALHLTLNKFANNDLKKSKSVAFVSIVLAPFFQVRPMSFVNTKEVDQEMVVDNIAGLLRHYALDPARFPSVTSLMKTGAFHFETTE